MTLGLSGQDTMVDSSGSATISSGTDETYTFSEPVRKAIIQHMGGSGKLYVRWNSNAASLTDWDDYVMIGERLESPADILIKTVTLYATAGFIKNDNFIVKGWE